MKLMKVGAKGRATCPPKVSYSEGKAGGAEGGYLGYWDFRYLYITLWENCDFYEFYGDFS